MQDWIRKYANGYQQIKEAISGLKEEELTFKPSPEEWSIREVVIHLADSELFWIQRMKKILAEDNPLFLAYDQDLWASRTYYNELNETQYLELLKVLRESFVEVLKKVSSEDWDRTGVHNVAGKLTLREVLESCVDHVGDHLRQIDRIKQAYESRG